MRKCGKVIENIFSIAFSWTRNKKTLENISKPFSGTQQNSWKYIHLSNQMQP